MKENILDSVAISLTGHKPAFFSSLHPCRSSRLPSSAFRVLLVSLIFLLKAFLLRSPHHQDLKKTQNKTENQGISSHQPCHSSRKIHFVFYPFHEPSPLALQHIHPYAAFIHSVGSKTTPSSDGQRDHSPFLCLHPFLTLMVDN